MDVALGLVGVVVLIAANGYFVAAEFSYVAVRRSTLTDLVAHDGRQAARATRAVSVIDRLSFMLSGAQLGITVTSLAVGYIAEPSIGEALHPVLESIGLGESTSRGVAVLLAFVVATSAQMIFGELAPKNLAIAKPEGVSLSLATSILTYTRLAGPAIRLFDGSANRLLRRLGIEPVETLHAAVTTDELDFIVEESARRGDLTRRQADLLGRALEFGELDAGEAMRPRNDVMTIPADASGLTLRLVAATVHSRLPVVAAERELDEIVGVVELKDLLGVPVAERDTVAVGDVMREALFVPEQLPLPDVLTQMRAHITEMAVVVDEYGSFAGIITDEDLAEELVGPIDDEHDELPDPSIEPLGGNRWRIPGSMRLDEIEREIDVVLPEGEYDTVAGLVLDRLGHFPEQVESVEVEGHLITVTAMEGLRITELELLVAPPDDDGASS